MILLTRGVFEIFYTNKDDLNCLAWVFLLFFFFKFLWGIILVCMGVLSFLLLLVTINVPISDLSPMRDT